MQTFVRMVDAVDGIDVTLAQRIGGSSNPHLQAGTHHLNGAEALAVARDRSEGVFLRGETESGAVRSTTEAAANLYCPRSRAGEFRAPCRRTSARLLGQLASRRPNAGQEHQLAHFPEELFIGTQPYDQSSNRLCLGL
jgi:hypothetical protein